MAGRTRASLVLVALVAGGLALAGCASSPPKALSASAILSVSPSSHTVHLELATAETGSVGGFNFDGYGEGEMTVSVPRGWTVVVDCHNDSTDFTHSCAIVQNLAPTPSGAPLAFPGAEIQQPTSGLAYGKSSTFSFVAARVGVYRIACLVTAHELDGMWDWFDVTAGGSPKVTFRR